jgi:ubiquinone biosynthesis protein COQ9
MALPNNLSISLQELASLCDDIWFLSGDKSVDFSWYTKRASVSTIYAAAELFMTTDKSEGFQDTKAFLGRRFEDSRYLKSTVGNLGEWTRFTARAIINVLRSKDFRV